MTRRDIVKAAINHQEAERVPYFIQLCGDAWDALKPVVRTESMDEFLDNDVQGFGIPWWNWHQLGNDWRAFDAPASHPSVIGTGSYPDFINNIRSARENSDKYFLVLIYGSHFEKAYFSRGIENFLADMAGEPAFAQKLLNTIIEKNLVMLENVLTLPEIDGVLLGSDWGSQIDLLMAPETWEAMIRPGERREYELIHAYGKDVWVHSCGCVESIIPSLIEIGLDVLNPIQPEAMDIQKLKADYGDQLAFWGGISTQDTLPFGSPEELKAETRRIRDMMSVNGGYILSPAQSIQSDVPVQNILALMEVARESPGFAGAGSSTD